MVLGYILTIPPMWWNIFSFLGFRGPLLYEQLHLFSMIKTICGVKQGLWKCWFRLQNEIKTGLQKRGRFRCLSYLWTCCYSKMGERGHSCRNLKNEIKTRWGDSINLLSCSHLINKSRRSYMQCLLSTGFVEHDTPHVFSCQKAHGLDSHKYTLPKS